MNKIKIIIKKLKMKQTRFKGVYELRKGKNKIILYTKNLVLGKKVYEERLVKEDGVEYRDWDPTRSKLAAAILKNIRKIGIKEQDIVLYLGAASGTTASHISDIVGKDGFIFALDFAHRVVRDLVFVCEDRKNIAPIMADANKPTSYLDKVSLVDVVYMDIAQREQAEIFLKNCDMFLKKGGYALLCVKARSVDVTRKPKSVFNMVKVKIAEKLRVIDYKDLRPFQKDHCMFVCQKI